jgi:carbamoyl-phosphate synthase large subunit
MNVLLTCVGRRNYLVRYFKQALKGRGSVFVADARADVPAFQEADESFRLPPIDHKDYIDSLLSICARLKICLIIPLTDPELPDLSEHRHRFIKIGTLPVVSSPEVIETCFDKWLTFTFLKRHGLDAVKTYVSLEEARLALSDGNASFPLVIKPRWGSASTGIEHVDDLAELELAYDLMQRRNARARSSHPRIMQSDAALVIQELLTGQEYGLDIINDLQGRYVATLVKQKLLMRAGETDRAITVRHEQLEQLGETIGQTLCHIGNLDCDVFDTGMGYYIVDMNPRFGGGYPFSHAAGADLPAALISWALCEEAEPRWLTVAPDVIASKYDSLAIVSPKKHSNKSA